MPEPVSREGALDAIRRLDELEDGWLDGEGRAPTHEGLGWLLKKFTACYPVNAPPPYVYPTPEGGVQFEWGFGDYSVDLEIDLAKHRGEYMAYNLMTKKSVESVHDLNVCETWEAMGDIIQSIKAKNIISMGIPANEPIEDAHRDMDQLQRQAWEGDD